MAGPGASGREEHVTRDRCVTETRGRVTETLVSCASSQLSGGRQRHRSLSCHELSLHAALHVAHPVVMT